MQTSPLFAMCIESQWIQAFEAADGDQDLIDASAINLYGRRVMDFRTKVKAGIRG
jgi:hypothetical protein